MLLDEDLPTAYRRDLLGHDVVTVEYMRWKGKDNGEILPLADPLFDALITADRKLPSEQDLSVLRRMGVVRIRGFRITLATLRPATSRVLAALENVRPGSLETVEV